jgi:uncharacterized oxidoreductase
MKLTGHTILITGGGSGIGGGLAKAFHEKGNKVIVTGRRKPTLKAFAAKHPGVDFFAMDVSKDADIQKLYKFISKKYPTLDVLINNAGIWQNQDFTKAQTLEKHLFDEIEINLKGLIRMTQVFLPLLQTRSSGPDERQLRAGLFASLDGAGLLRHQGGGPFFFHVPAPSTAQNLCDGH